MVTVIFWEEDGSFDPKRRTIMIKADYHMHTYFSSDSDTPPEAMALGAIKKGLRWICITDHHDWDYPEDKVSFVSISTVSSGNPKTERRLSGPDLHSDGSRDRIPETSRAIL